VFYIPLVPVAVFGVGVVGLRGLGLRGLLTSIERCVVLCV
jgi:hypothetical protein